MHDSAFLTDYCITYYPFLKLTKLLGGGGQNDMFAPQYFHWGATAPQPPPPTPRIDASGGKRLGRARGDCTVADPGFAKKGRAENFRARSAPRAPHKGGVQGPAVGPLAGCRGKEPPEALEFSANKGLQDGRQE